MTNNDNQQAITTALSQSVHDRLIFRAVQPTDIPRCHEIEKASYPPDEAASKSQLQYRQHHAAPFFRCAFLIDDNGFGNTGGGRNSGTDHTPLTQTHNDPFSPMSSTSTQASVSYRGRAASVQSTVRGTIIGYICSTRAASFTEEAMKSHDPRGKLLAVHSVVVEKKYRNMGVASAMIHDYISAMERLNRGNSLKVKMEKLVLIAKKDLLGFYVRNGFRAMKLSDVVHGKDPWFDMERDLESAKEQEEEKTRHFHECYLVDAFADPEREGSGNPAGVVLLKGPPGKTDKNCVYNERLDNGDDDDNSLDDIAEDVEIDTTTKPEKSGISPRGLEWMAVVAKEFNQAETAFVWPVQMPTLDISTPAPSGYAIRYFTRTGVEVDLCGHATLASASVLLNSKEKKDAKDNRITFYAKHDVLQADLLVTPTNCTNQSNTQISLSTPNASRIAMNFPWKNVTPVPTGENGAEAVLDMLSRAFFKAGCSSSGKEVESALTSRFVKFFSGKNESNPCPFSSEHVLHIGTTDGKEDLFLELTEEGFDLLRGIDVDHDALARGWDGYSRGVIICCCASQGSSPENIAPVDFRSRFFGPKVGIDEDPVTGSAHCSLGPYFGLKLGKTTVVGRQESERSGLVECTLKQEEGRVNIVGTAVTTISGHLAIRI
mmetsp:Transcript_16022/g.33874  ORF Transcript_16022/g.33874 Transcript_16022/m.33874 type:complete len:659 (+) Transcript_16022:148-2124(+)